MPDDDRIPRNLTGKWKKVLRRLRNRLPKEETTDAVTIAIAETIRDVHGVPDLPVIAARMQQTAAAGASVHSRIPGSSQARVHVPTDVAERAAAGFEVPDPLRTVALMRSARRGAARRPRTTAPRRCRSGSSWQTWPRRPGTAGTRRSRPGASRRPGACAGGPAVMIMAPSCPRTTRSAPLPPARPNVPKLAASPDCGAGEAATLAGPALSRPRGATHAAPEGGPPGTAARTAASQPRSG